MKNIRSVLDISKGYGLEFGLKLTVDENKISNELKESVKQEIGQLPMGTWSLYDPVDRGPGTSFRQIIFNPTWIGSHNLITSVDLDQIPLENESLGILNDLIERVKAENSLCAIGSRNIPIKLAIYEKNSNLRIIHELFNSLTIGSKKLKVTEPKIDILKANPSYKEIGESTTGVYIFNTSHSKYKELMNYVNIFALFRGFATEYYTMIKASELGNISTGYVNFKENKFYKQVNEKQELAGIEKLIEGQTAELAKTDISNKLRDTLSKEKNAKKILEFFDKNEVQWVKDLMIMRLNQ